MKSLRLLASAVFVALMFGCGGVKTGTSFSSDLTSGGVIEGISLGSSGSQFGLDAGRNYIPDISMYRTTVAGKPTEFGLGATIITVEHPLNLQNMQVENGGPKRTFTGKVTRTDSYFSVTGERRVEGFEVPLTPDDCRWLASRTAPLELYLDGEHIWATTTLNASQIAAIGKFCEMYLPQANN